MDTKDLIRYGLLGVAAYMAYTHFKSTGVIGGGDGGDGGDGGGGGGGPAPQLPGRTPAPQLPGPVAIQPTPAPAVPNIADQIRVMGQQQMSGNLATADQWNFFAKEVTGKTQPDPEWFGFVGEGRDDLVTFETWYGRLTQAGFGLSGLAGLGWGGRLGWGQENVWAT